MIRAFFDSNVLVYSVNREDPKRLRAVEIMARGGVIGAQSLNEFVTVTRRKLGMSWPAVASARDEILALFPSVVPLTVEVHRLGVEVAVAHRLAVYDAMIVAAALTADCDTLYSEDMHAGLVVGGKLRIVNPFA